MQSDVVTQTVELLLAATFVGQRPGMRRHSFMFGRPGAPHWDRRFVIELSHDGSTLAKAAILARKKGAPHLRELPIQKIESMLTDFLSENYWYFVDDTFLKDIEGNLLAHTSVAAQVAFADALARSDIFHDPEILALFPLVVVRVASGFDSQPFFLAPADGLTGSRLPEGISEREIQSEHFPPLREWDGRRYSPASWLGVRAPNEDVAVRVRASILGAIALLPHHLERWLFTGREVFGGKCVLSTGFTFSTGESHTPRLAEDIIVGEADKPWLATLAGKLVSDALTDVKHLKALEYFYRAWAPDEAKRFPTLFAALDAIFGDAGQATQAIITAVSPILDPKFDYVRVKLLLSLRASVIHGGAPNIHESKKYEKYYEEYGEDPIRDLQLIVARCLQQTIFGGELVERPHTHANLIASHNGTVD